MKSVIILTFGLLLLSCNSTNYMGAQKYSTGGFYTSRWFLNKEYNLEQQPKGTEFYGAAAQKIRHRYTIKYYVSDNQGDEIEIPGKHIWKIIPDKLVNEKPYYWNWKYKDIYLYKKYIDTYVEYNAISAPSDIILNSFSSRVNTIPIQSCDAEGWCKSYVWTHHNDRFKSEMKSKIKYNLDDVFYIKRKYLYQGEDRLFEFQKRKLKRQNIIAKTASLPFITPVRETCLKHNGDFTDNACRLEGRYVAKICKDSGGRVPTYIELMNVVKKCGGPIGKHELPNPDEKSSDKLNQYESCYLNAGFTYGSYFFSYTKKSETAGGETIDAIHFIYFKRGIGWWSGTDKTEASGYIICHAQS